MAEALTSTAGRALFLASAATSARVASTRLERSKRLRAAVQRPWAIGAPPRFTTASAPTAAPPSSPVAGFQATSKAPAVPPPARVSGRTRRHTVCPSAARDRVSVVPTSPVAPVIRIFMVLPPRGARSEEYNRSAALSARAKGGHADQGALFRAAQGAFGLCGGAGGAAGRRRGRGAVPALRGGAPGTSAVPRFAGRRPQPRVRALEHCAPAGRRGWLSAPGERGLSAA